MFIKALTIWLVALAISPFTAPFSSCGLKDLFAKLPSRTRSEIVDTALTMNNVTQPTVPDTRTGGDVRPESVRHDDGAPAAAAAVLPLVVVIDLIDRRPKDILVIVPSQDTPARPPTVLRI
jgi:hypothetical protein